MKFQNSAGDDDSGNSGVAWFCFFFPLSTTNQPTNQMSHMINHFRGNKKICMTALIFIRKHNVFHCVIILVSFCTVEGFFSTL